MEILQFDLETNYPNRDLAVEILGVNGAGEEVGNQWFTAVANRPWLQDVDANFNGASDVWEDWQVEYRDVIVLDAANQPIATFNLTDKNLQFLENYSELRRIFVAAATVGALEGDFNANGSVEQADLDLVLLNWGSLLVNPGGEGWTRDLPQGSVDQGELDKVLLNWGSRAGLATAIPEPSTLVMTLLLALVVLARRH